MRGFRPRTPLLRLKTRGRTGASANTRPARSDVPALDPDRKRRTLAVRGIAWPAPVRTLAAGIQMPCWPTPVTTPPPRAGALQQGRHNRSTIVNTTEAVLLSARERVVVRSAPPVRIFANGERHE